MLAALQRMGRLLPVACQIGGAAEQVLVAIDLEGRQTRSSSHRMTGIGVAVEQLDSPLACRHHVVINGVAHQHRPHRDGAVGQPLGAGDHVGDDIELLGGEGGAEATETGDHLVKNQQDTVLGADLPQPLEVAFGRHQHAGTAGDGLDNHRRDIAGIVQKDDLLQLVGQRHILLGQPFGEGILGDIEGMRQMIHPGQQGAEPLAVAGNASHRDSTEADPVVTTLAANQPGASALTARPLPGQRDFERGIDRLGARVGIEDMAEPLGGDLHQLVGQLERQGVAHLESGGKIEVGNLLGDRLGNLAPTMARVATPESGCAIQYLAAIL